MRAVELKCVYVRVSQSTGYFYGLRQCVWYDGFFNDGKIVRVRVAFFFAATACLGCFY